MSLNSLNWENTETIDHSIKSLMALLPINIVPSILICLMLLTSVLGQTKQYTGDTSDQNLRGSDRVNSSTLGMEFDLSLGAYPGRGINLPINLSYSSKVWRMKYMLTNPSAGHNVTCYSLISANYAEKSASGWTTSLEVPYIEYIGQNSAYNQDGTVYNDEITGACDPGYSGSTPVYNIRRIILHLPSGETHELRLNDTPVTGSISWEGHYYAADGSNIKYIQDTTTTPVTYKVLLPDGSSYDLNTGSGLNNRYANKFTDRNGNYTTYHNDDLVNYPNGYWKDTLGKNIPVPFKPVAPGSPTSTQSPQTYLLPGMTASYKFHWKYLKGSSAEESGLANFADSSKYLSNARVLTNGQWDYHLSNTSFLFTSVHPFDLVDGYNSTHNPIVLTQIDLPTGAKYKFRYNVYGEIIKIDYPTGSQELFEYNPVDSTSIMEAPYSQANRGVTNRKVYETAGTGTPSEWQYATPSNGVVQITNPDNTKTVRFMHTGNVESSFGYDNPLAGMPYRELSFSISGQLQTEKLRYWTSSTNGWQPRIVREDSVIYNSGGDGLSATAIYGYEGDLSYKETPVLVNKTTQYAFVTTSGNTITSSNLPTATPPTLPSVPPTPVRITESTYLINDTVNYPSSTVRDAYKAQNMIGLVTVSKVLNGAGTTVVAKSEMKYDEGGNYSLISESSPPSRWALPNTSYRGNPTTMKNWKDITNNQYVQTHARFDDYGNQRKAWDALGNSAETTFDSTYFAYPLSTTSAAPDQGNGAYGSTTGFTTSATFNTTTGLPLTKTDINGQTTTMAYDAATLRPTSVTAPNNQQTQYIYGTPDSTSGGYSVSQRFTKVKTQIDANNWKEGYNWSDGLGRTIKSQSVDSNGDALTITCYDQMGRVAKSSNPFKNVSNPSCESNLEWTTPTYDAMGRPTMVTSPDTTTVQMAYGISTSGVIGITKTVTDQAGRKRLGITDALGNIVRVIEDPNTQQALITDYVFDTVGNLRKTTQIDGLTEQNRFFMHDDLGRLLYAKQPEQDTNSNLSATDPITNNTQWSVKYLYDDNGNATSTTDARNNSITATYDHLNRLILRDYSDPSTADVTFYYDGKGLGSVPSNSKGKVTNVSNSASETRYTSFDNMGRILTSDQRTTPGQRDFSEPAYTFSYAYNLSGALIEETYPSGRKVKNTLNADGELSMVQSKKNANAGYYAYAMALSYTVTGALEKLRLGNGHWENYEYNNRQQIKKIGLGRTDSTQDLLKLEYSYGVWESGTLNTGKNNGAPAQQIITVPNSVGNSDAFAATQKYTYDSLNRLESATETVTGLQNPTWKQTFTYDRYGNRRFDANNTTTLGSCSAAICNPDMDKSKNRLSTAQGYTYDANGSLTQDATGKRFGYDSDNRQKEFFVSSNSSTTPDATYHYDGEGRRVKKTSSTEETIFVYDAGGQLVAEYSIALPATQRVSYLTADHLGSPRIITNEIGQVVKRQDYTAFGEETVTSQRTGRIDYTVPDEIRQDYTGYQKDSESGLEYAQARYYNSSHGRFTSIDPLTASATIRNPQSLNRYSYVLNSPYKFSDPLGLAPWCSTCSSNDEPGFLPKRSAPTRRPNAPPPAPPPQISVEIDSITYTGTLQSSTTTVGSTGGVKLTLNYGWKTSHTNETGTSTYEVSEVVGNILNDAVSRIATNSINAQNSLDNFTEVGKTTLTLEGSADFGKKYNKATVTGGNAGLSVSLELNSREAISDNTTLANTSIQQQLVHDLNKESMIVAWSNDKKVPIVDQKISSGQTLASAFAQKVRDTGNKAARDHYNETHFEKPVMKSSF